MAPVPQAEINYLLGHLEQSGCKFFRNGSWYAATDARAHLKKKYDYLADKGMIKSAEDFIEKGASESSMSHQAYQVSCSGAQSVPSAKWLSDALIQYRKESAAHK
jgi:hypothetical protein